MKKIFLLAALIPVFASAQKKMGTFRLSGSITNAPKDIEWIFISYMSDSERKTDSMKLENGKYDFKGRIAEPVLASLRIKYAVTPDGKTKPVLIRRDVVSVFLEKGKIKVTSVDSLSNVKVKRSASNDELVKLNKLAKPYMDQMSVLNSRYTEYDKNKDEANLKKTEEEITALSNEMKENVYGNYVKANSSSPVALYAVRQYAGWDIDAAKVEPVFNLLPSATRSLPSGVRFKEQLDIAKRTAIGVVAMDFTQNDTLGTPVSLSSFRGKYVLVDFWASWCGPCRKENPNVVKAFKQYREKGFHIVGVSLDRQGQKDKWIQAIHDDKLEWTHVSDLKFWQNDVAVMYGVSAIPQNLLLDPQGRIIAKNLRGEELDKKLEEFIVEGKKAF